MSSPLVVDASVAVKWFVPEELSEHADLIAASGSMLLAPKLVLLDVANAFWRKVQRHLISADDAIEYLA